MKKVALVGLGACGTQVARQLPLETIEHLYLYDKDYLKVETVGSALGQRVKVSCFKDFSSVDVDVAILAMSAGEHVFFAKKFLEQGAHVLSISDDLDEVRSLLGLHDCARSFQRSLIIGAGFSPGLSCLLVKKASEEFDKIKSISLYKVGTGGPACARQHHRALKGASHDWFDGEWISRRGASSRYLAWFPEPIGAQDCYSGALAGPLLLQASFPSAERIIERIGANRRARLTTRLPMLRTPHKDGGPGALRVEVKGYISGGIETIVYGIMDYPSVATGALASTIAPLLTAPGRVHGGVYSVSSIGFSSEIVSGLYAKGIKFAKFH